MTVLYADTSALAKRYLSEVGSAWVRGLVTPSVGNLIVISELTSVEVFSLLERRRREGSLSGADVALLEADFLVHAQTEYLVLATESASFVQARALVQKYPLRTLDALQLAGALEAKAIASESIMFVSGDTSLLAAAASEGLDVDDPNAHP